MVALTAANDLVALGVADFHLILPGQLQCGFDALGSPAGEVDASASEILPRKFQQFLRKSFRDWRGELAAVNEFKVPRLFCHGGADLVDTVSDEVHHR